jgi:hypothetical protein
VGLVGVRRVLDSAPLEDGVTTQDTPSGDLLACVK